MMIMFKSPAPMLRTTIGHASGLSITALIESIRWSIMILPILLSFASIAQAAETISVSESIEYEDILSDGDASQSSALAQFGAFRVVSHSLVELVDAIDSDSPAHFQRMMALYPHIKTIRMIECPGTVDDEANLSIARMIRARGLNTHVPARGSIRSGGVELFLAGVKRTAEQGAEFGVHSWQDDEGREASDVPADDPVHADYIGYYQAMGLAPQVAREFYAFTNAAARFDDVHFMTPTELTRFHIIN
jgi:hypothetical protein